MRAAARRRGSRWRERDRYIGRLHIHIAVSKDKHDRDVVISCFGIGMCGAGSLCDERLRAITKIPGDRDEFGRSLKTCRVIWPGGVEVDRRFDMCAAGACMHTARRAWERDADSDIDRGRTLGSARIRGDQCHYSHAVDIHELMLHTLASRAGVVAKVPGIGEL